MWSDGLWLRSVLGFLDRIEIACQDPYLYLQIWIMQIPCIGARALFVSPETGAHIYLTTDSRRKEETNEQWVRYATSIRSDNQTPSDQISQPASQPASGRRTWKDGPACVIEGFCFFLFPS